MYGHLLFTDIKGFSALNDSQLRIFYEKMLPALFKSLSPSLETAKAYNTWGDALFAVFEDIQPAVTTALAYREFLRSYNFAEAGLTRLSSRIACHSGEFGIFNDPFDTNKKNVIGNEVNCAARLEPVTRPGEIFVTNYFKDNVDRNTTLRSTVKFSELGEIKLAKGWKEQTVFRMYGVREKDRQTIDRLIRLNLGEILPEATPLSPQERATLNALKNEESSEALLARIAGKEFNGSSISFITSLANICKDFGLYSESIRYIEKTMAMGLNVDGLTIYPQKNNTNLSKLHANCLSRIGRYEDAANIIYGLWQSGNKDADTLSMLAAQYKRMALYGTNGKLLDPKQFNKKLLIRSRNLYIEAFRRDISAFYPLLNAAYLMCFCPDPLLGKGSFAQYLIDTFTPEDPQDIQDWWHAAALAEAEMLNDEITIAVQQFENAKKHFEPKQFERDSTRKQIELYGYITNSSDRISPILEVLL